MAPFFLDRSLGRVQLPQLLRDDGWELHTLAEVFGVPKDETVSDVEWLTLAGANGWPVLMKDQRIRYRSAEVGALIDSSVRAFVLTSRNLTAREMARAFITHKSRIHAEALKPGSALFAVTTSSIREIDLSAYESRGYL